MKKYGEEELEEILTDLKDSDYEIKIGEDFSLSKSIPMVYIIGKPKRK